MTHVLHIITGLGVGGAETALFRLVQKSDPGIRHSVISLTGSGAMCVRLHQIGIEPILLDLKKSFFSDFFRLIYLIGTLRPTIVQTWMYHSDFLGGIAAKLAGCRKVIWGIRHTAFSKGSSRATILLMRLCALFSYFIPDVIVCVADASRRAHMRYGYSKKKMIVIPNGLESVDFKLDECRYEFRSKYDLSIDDIVIGIVGRFHPDKDHRTFVKMAELLVSVHKNLRFIMVGRGLNKNNSELIGMFSEPALAERFIFLGERDDVAVCLSAMDIFCLTSRFEGFPNVVAEAMAAGLPCVATDAGDARFLLGETGTVVPVESPEALCKAVDELIVRGAENRAFIGRAARERVRTHFSVEKMRARFSSIYFFLCKKRRAALVEN